MTLTKKRRRILELIIVLMVINYMVVTIILHDIFIFKYLRDILMIFMTIMIIVTNNYNIKIKKSSIYFIEMLFIFCLLIGMAQTLSLKLMFLVARRYLFPLCMLFVTSNIDFKNNEAILYKFIFIFVVLLAFFGVLQAQILGDGFLRRLGYPVEYSYWYKRDMLYNSFYFGGLGIQRVVATLSSSNICGLVFGSIFLYLLICNNYLEDINFKKTFYVILALGYLLTFSRSNFLAMFIIVIIIAWKYIPYKNYIILGILLSGVGMMAIGIIQGQNGILYKMFTWIQNSFYMKESSAAGRSVIWQMAFEQVLKSPFGIGLGRVGGISNNASISDFRFSAENSYLALALDTGWVGLISYVTFMFLLIYKLRKYATDFKIMGDIKGNRLCVAGYIVIIYLMIVMFFSNHIHDMEAVAMVYLFAGIGFSYKKFHKAVNKKIISDIKNV